MHSSLLPDSSVRWAPPVFDSLDSQLHLLKVLRLLSSTWVLMQVLHFGNPLQAVSWKIIELPSLFSHLWNTDIQTNIQGLDIQNRKPSIFTSTLFFSCFQSGLTPILLLHLEWEAKSLYVSPYNVHYMFIMTKNLTVLCRKVEWMLLFFVLIL